MASVKYLAPDTDAYVDSVVRHQDEFTEETGVDLEIQIVPSDQYFSNDIAGYLTSSEPPDVFMSGPVLLWQHIGASLVEPLDQFVETASDTFDLDDFFLQLIASNRWTGRFGDPLGQGSLWEIPVNCESYNLTYVPEILDRFEVQVPRTWGEYFAAARGIAQRSNGGTIGFGQRGIQVWHTMYTGFATQFWAYGGQDFDGSGRCAIASPEAVDATTDFVGALRDAGPPDLLNQRWYELAMDFCDGKYGLIVDSDHYVAFYEDEDSPIRGKTGYALTPMGPDGNRAANLWTWSLVMNARSRDKESAWRFIEWAAGPEFLRKSTFEGNMNPTRRSTWDHPRFVDLASGWGDFYQVARELISSQAKVLVTPAPNYLALAERWVLALRQAYSGENGVLEALEMAASDIDALVAGFEPSDFDRPACGDPTGT